MSPSIAPSFSAASLVTSTAPCSIAVLAMTRIEVGLGPSLPFEGGTHGRVASGKRQVERQHAPARARRIARGVPGSPPGALTSRRRTGWGSGQLEESSGSARSRMPTASCSERGRTLSLVGLAPLDVSAVRGDARILRLDCST